MSNNVDWKDLFGSDDEEEDITIPGLKLLKNALNHEEQMHLVESLIEKEYFCQDRNQVMLFGELPTFINWLINLIKARFPDLFETNILNREPLFDQAILNMYKKGEGITSHVDLLRFDDGILIVSLLSSCVMKMRPANEDSTSYSKKDHTDTDTVDILLNPGDILALSKDARYKWEHGIEETLYDKINDDIIERGTRLSITLRKLLKDSEHLASVTKTNR